MKKKMFTMMLCILMFPVLVSCSNAETMNLDDHDIVANKDVSCNDVAVNEDINLSNQVDTTDNNQPLKNDEVIQEETGKATVNSKDKTDTESKKSIAIDAKKESQQSTNTSTTNQNDSSVDTQKAVQSIPTQKSNDNSNASQTSNNRLTTSQEDTDKHSSNLSQGDDNSNQPTSLPSTSQEVSNIKPTDESNQEKKQELVWAMSEARMIDYAKQCVSDWGFIWIEDATKENSGWFAPSTVRITYTEDEIKAKIKGRVDSTLSLLNSEQYGIKVFFEKEDNNAYKVYCLY